MYENFKIGPKSGNYVLHAEGYSGTAGDGLGGVANVHNGKPFSTKDKDNDEAKKSSCAQVYKGAWWYQACHSVNLNGMYHNGSHESYADGINWALWKGHYYSLRFTEMKCREHVC